jgi:uncharacterized membrane protein YozB (DUF420 family)
MNLFLDPPGFLGTGASFLADLTLLAYILLIVPAMLIGLILARMGRHRPHHKWLMIGITVVNWLLILFLMLAAFTTDIAPNLGQNVTQPRYFLPGIHTLFGLPAQLLATYVVFRMLREDAQVRQARQRGETDLQKYWFKSAKWAMRGVLSLWLLTASLGIVSYVVRYNVLNVGGTNVPAPAATEQVELFVEGTQEAQHP